MIADIKIRLIDFFRKSAPEIGAASMVVYVWTWKVRGQFNLKDTAGTKSPFVSPDSRLK